MPLKDIEEKVENNLQSRMRLAIAKQTTFAEIKRRKSESLGEIKARLPKQLGFVNWLIYKKIDSPESRVIQQWFTTTMEKPENRMNVPEQLQQKLVKSLSDVSRNWQQM